MTEIPAYAMPSNPFEKQVVKETIKDMVCRQIFDPSGPILDVRTCAALIVGDDVKAVRDPEAMRTLLANDEFRARLLRMWPNARIYYARKPRKKKLAQ
ncbi:hypothetical protein [Nocardia sp. NPDC004260]